VPTENPAIRITTIAILVPIHGAGRVNLPASFCPCEFSQVSGSPMRSPPHTSLPHNGYCRQEIFSPGVTREL
jgi:hypothetical protein